MRNSVDLENSRFGAEKLLNKIAYKELFRSNIERANSNSFVLNLKIFTMCMYRKQIDYVSFDFLMFALSGLPQFNERSIFWDKVDKCDFEHMFGKKEKKPIQRKHTPKHYADVNDDKTREFWDYKEFVVKYG